MGTFLVSNINDLLEFDHRHVTTLAVMELKGTLISLHDFTDSWKLVSNVSPRTQDVNSQFIRCSDDIQDIF